MTEYITNTGVTPLVLGTFADADTSWANWATPWVFNTNGESPFPAWMAANPTGMLVVAVRLVSAQACQPGTSTYDSLWPEHGAAGQFNAYATQLGQYINATGYGARVILRVNHEMNGNWYYDAAGNLPASRYPAYIGCEQQIYGAIKKACPGVLIDWCLNANYQVVDPASLYPGSQYVDFIGLDAYDTASSPALPPPGPARIAAFNGEPLGLNAIASFAAGQGKPISIPEWGTMIAGSSPNAGGDNASYVEGMAAFINSHPVAYHCWFNATTDPQLDDALPLDSTAPNSLAAYKAAFAQVNYQSLYQAAIAQIQSVGVTQPTQWLAANPGQPARSYLASLAGKNAAWLKGHPSS